MADMVDVSSLQHPEARGIDWHKVKASGVSAVMVKATESVHYTNPWLERDAKGAFQAGILTGYYHFAHPGDSTPARQVAYFANAIGRLPHRIGLALDLERSDGKSWAELDAWGETFLRALEAHTSWPILYSNRSWLASMPHAPWGRRLWLASPGVHPETKPYAWQMGTASVPGIPAVVDVGQLYDVPLV